MKCGSSVGLCVFAVCGRVAFQHRLIITDSHKVDVTHAQSSRGRSIRHAGG